MSKIQAVTVNGAIIDKGCWEILTNTMQVGHIVDVCLYTRDKNLLSHVKKHAKTGCDVGTENEKTYVVVTFTVEKIRHMVDESNFESMYMVVPVNRFVEQTILYLLDPEKCEPKFAEAVRQG
jgi:hypothetical protein